MKKRVLLSLVSLFMMTTMWAAIAESYYVSVTGASNPSKTWGTATLTLSFNQRSQNAANVLSFTLAGLPEGVTIQSIEPVTGRFPEAYGTPNFEFTPNADGSYTITCTGEEGVGILNTSGEIATITVDIAGTVVAGDYTLKVMNQTFTTVAGSPVTNTLVKEYTWTIEEGEEPQPEFPRGDVNCDGQVTIADAVTVLNAMAGEEVPGDADVNVDGSVTIADFVTVLNIMAGTEE